MSLAMSLEALMPGALYSGSLTADTPEAYAAIQWLDTRPKPPYEAVAAGTKDIQKDNLKAYAAKLRYKRQRGGYSWRGKKFNSDANAITAMTMAHALAVKNASYNTQWKMADGKFQNLDSANVIGAYGAITGFVQALFNAEAVVHAAIDAGSVTNPTQVISAINSVPNAS